MFPNVSAQKIINFHIIVVQGFINNFLDRDRFTLIFRSALLVKFTIFVFLSFKGTEAGT